MSRHQAIEQLDCCASSSTVAIDWAQFVSGSSGTSEPSPIDNFDLAHVGLIKLSGLVGASIIDPDASLILAGQVVLGYVSATELYLRQTVARMVRLCPFTRASNRDQMIPFGAIDYYGSGDVEQALTERVSFSEVGAVKKQLEARLSMKVDPTTSLARSIEDFERLCQLRHALVHAHGVINSANAALLLAESTSEAKVVALDSQCLQWTASVAVNLVRDVNQELFRSTIWRWVREGHLTGDGRKDKPKINRLIATLGSTKTRKGVRSISSASDVRAAVATVIRDLTKAGAVASRTRGPV